MKKYIDYLENEGCEVLDWSADHKYITFKNPASIDYSLVFSIELENLEQIMFSTDVRVLILSKLLSQSTCYHGETNEEIDYQHEY